MFAYCGNNPISYSDPYGTHLQQACYDENLVSDILQAFLGGGGSTVGNTVAAASASLVVLACMSSLEFAEARKLYGLFSGGNDGVSGKIVYVGRVKFTNFNSRMSYHLSQGRQLAWCITGLIYAECRAIEQGDMMYYHTINRSDNLMNHIRGVSPTNSNKERYFMAIMDLINSGMYLK